VLVSAARVPEVPRPGPDPRIAAAAAGDRAAARALLLELTPRVRNLVRYLVRGDEDVDDVAQEALIAIVRGLPTFRGDGTFESWSDRVTARATFAVIRKRRTEDAARRDAGPDLAAVGEGDRPDEYLQRRRVVERLDAVPDAQRHAIVLHHVAGMSVGEVAEELSVPAETVRSRIRLGMARLREGGENNGA